jgi:prepilin-type N-terminal cleavage/methylation domain-containing protein
MSKIDTKNRYSFTLIEIIIVIIILGIVSYFTFSKIDNFTISTKPNISILNIKDRLLKYDFKDNISLKCINDGALCYIYVDNILSKNTIKNLFKSKPTVYSYSKDLDIIEFEDLELDKLESYEVCFEYTINKYQKTKDFILEVDDKVYIFNSIQQYPISIEYLSDVGDYFDDKKEEMKDAF